MVEPAANDGTVRCRAQHNQLPLQINFCFQGISRGGNYSKNSNSLKGRRPGSGTIGGFLQPGHGDSRWILGKQLSGYSVSHLDDQDPAGVYRQRLCAG